MVVIIDYHENFLPDRFQGWVAFRFPILTTTISNCVFCTDWHSTVDVFVVNQSTKSIVLELWKFLKIFGNKIILFIKSRSIVIVATDNCLKQFSLCFNQHWAVSRLRLDALVDRCVFLATRKWAEKLLALKNQKTEPTKRVIQFITFRNRSLFSWFGFCCLRWNKLGEC